MKDTKTLFRIALAMLFITGMAGLSFAAPPGSQPPSSANTVPMVFPDVRMIQVSYKSHIRMAQGRHTICSRRSGSRNMRVYESAGVLRRALYNRLDLDGTIYREQEFGTPRENPPELQPGSCVSAVFGTGAHGPLPLAVIL